MALWLVTPVRMISSMIGRTLAANRLALALAAALPRLATSAIPGGCLNAARASWRRQTDFGVLRDHLALMLIHAR
jgi:hypothetical protein